MTDEGLYLGEASRLFGVTVRRIDEWLRLGWVQETTGRANGRGHRKVIPWRELPIIDRAVSRARRNELLYIPSSFFNEARAAGATLPEQDAGS